MRTFKLVAAGIALTFLMAANLMAGEKEVRGELGCAKCCFGMGDACAAAIRVDGKVHLIEASDKADENTKKAISEAKSAKTTKKVKATVNDSSNKWAVAGMAEEKE